MMYPFLEEAHAKENVKLSLCCKWEKTASSGDEMLYLRPVHFLLSCKRSTSHHMFRKIMFIIKVLQCLQAFKIEIMNFLELGKVIHIWRYLCSPKHQFFKTTSRMTLKLPTVHLCFALQFVFILSSSFSFLPFPASFKMF